jgi:hypothetical protein
MKNTIKEEHQALAAALVDKLKNMELPNVQDHYEAIRDAVNELSSAMYRHYHVDALPAIADLFCELFDATGNVCGSVRADFMREIFDEDGELEDIEDASSWEDASYAIISTSEVNWSPAPGCAWAETFAGDVDDCIKRCISGWGYVYYDTDFDHDYQDFQYRK